MAGAVSVTGSEPESEADSDPESEVELYKGRNHLQLRSWQSVSGHNS